MLSVRNLTLEEIRAFGYDWANAVNWGVCLDGEPVAYFSAEPEEDGRLEVHVTALRHRLHPQVLKMCAKQLSNRLLALGANGLVAKIAPGNRASLSVAKAAGFVELSRDNETIVLVKHEQTEDATIT